MRLSTARELGKIKDSKARSIPRFFEDIPKKKRHSSKATSKKDPKNDPPQAAPARLAWKDILSPVEVKQDPDREWPHLRTFASDVIPVMDKVTDENPLTSRTDPATPLETSQSRTCKIHAPVRVCTTDH
jgi:hypothetical protein